MSEMEDNVMQKVGRVKTRRRRLMDYTRHENSTRVNNVKSSRLGQRDTHNGSLQVNPIITQEEQLGNGQVIVLNLFFILFFFYLLDNVRIGSRKGNTADQRLRSEAGPSWERVSSGTKGSHKDEESRMKEELEIIQNKRLDYSH